MLKKQYNFISLKKIILKKLFYNYQYWKKNPDHFFVKTTFFSELFHK